MKKKLLAIIFILLVAFVRAENGYDLWLRYPPIKNTMLLASYRLALQQISLQGNSATIQIAKAELVKASQSMLGQTPSFTTGNLNCSSLVIGKMGGSLTAGPLLKNDIKDIGEEGYSIITSMVNGKAQIIIRGNTDVSLLYGVFHLLRLMQTQKDIHELHIISIPKLKLRLLDHWDNLNRTVERGYAGSSIWDWHKLPGYINQRYIDYARANASIGINGTVLNNVNANATILTAPYLIKVKALADVFRPYGIKVYLTARFSSPIEIGGLKTADPLNEEVQLWWKLKAKEIYAIIPDFGGFVVKANSEGQPGPQEYKRTHADGANMLADAVAPYNGIVIWRAFVYAAQNPFDRHKQAYEDFVPLDGQFKNNVMVQVKNGAIDFMPREPSH
ncbi:MAG: alpha-glucuronidase, partial [Ferruginibacter sp.]|nr:alpha-glucuronidase [Ferruginibacter sp.]